VQHREAGLEQLDDDTRQIQETSMAENDRYGALDAIKVRTAIARERRGYLDLFGQLSGELAHANPSATLVQGEPGSQVGGCGQSERHAGSASRVERTATKWRWRWTGWGPAVPAPRYALEGRRTIGSP